MTSLIVAGGIAVVALAIMALAYREIFKQGGIAERERNLVSERQAVVVSKEISDAVAKQDIGALCDELSLWMRDRKR